MTKIWKNTIRCIVVLAIVSFASVVMVLFANYILPAKTSFFDKKKLNIVCPAVSYHQLTENDLTEININLEAFNKNHNSASIRAVFRAEGGQNNGNYIIEAEGLGYSDAYVVIVYIAYNNHGEIIGITDLFVDKGNTFWSQLKPYLPDVYNNLKGRSAFDDDLSGAGLQSHTGATQSLNGIARAINISNRLITTILESDAKQPYTVTDTTMLEKLRETTNGQESFICYPYKAVEIMDTLDEKIAATEILSVYISNNGQILFHTKSEAGTYGSATLLVLVNEENKSVIKVNPLYLFLQDKGGNKPVISEFLDDMDTLTNIFQDLTIEEINNMDKHLTGSTGATQTANGIKTAIIAALKNIDAFNTYFENLGGEQNG